MQNLKAKVQLLESILKNGWIDTARQLGKPVSVLTKQVGKICDNPGPRLAKIADKHGLLTADGRINLKFPAVDAGDNLYSLFCGKGNHVEKR